MKQILLSVVPALAAALWAQPLLQAAEKPSVRVMTWNVDAGTDLNYIFAATDAASFAKGMALTFAEIQGSAFQQRASRQAADIGSARPELVALQEVTLWRKGKLLSPPATEVLYDQLDLLMTELAKRGLSYSVVAVQTLLDVEAPSPVDGIDLRLTDRDVILARNDLLQAEMDITNAQARRYQSTFVFGNDLLGKIPVYRGWMSVDVSLRGSSFRFVNTHLESPVPGLAETDQSQVKQAAELMAALSDSALPVILAGDFNSNAEPGQDHFDTNRVILAAGFADSWRALHPGDPGHTWPLFGEDQLSGPAIPYERIDIIYTRGLKNVGFSRGMNVLGVELCGVTQPWPADHAGVVATIRLD